MNWEMPKEDIRGPESGTLPREMVAVMIFKWRAVDRMGMGGNNKGRQVNGTNSVDVFFNEHWSVGGVTNQLYLTARKRAVELWRCAPNEVEIEPISYSIKYR